MKSFTPEQLNKQVAVGLAWLLSSVTESKGRQELFENQRPEVLKRLRQIAIVQSTESSNRIEGVTVERQRLEPLVFGKTKPRDRLEEEIVGYREALSWIHEEHAAIEITPQALKKLHALAQGGFSGDAGEFKQINNDIIEIHPDGTRFLRFQTVAASKVPESIEQLCLAYRHTLNQGPLPPLLNIACFVFDFLCIHPFRDGNGRVSRLLTLLLLYHHEYRVGRYISLERIVEETKESYYESLGASSQDWHQGKHELTPWYSYFLSIMRRAYKEFEKRVDRLNGQRGAKTETLHRAIEDLPAEFTISELQQRCIDVSKDQIRKVLRTKRDQGQLICTGRGRGARWKKVGTN